MNLEDIKKGILVVGMSPRGLVSTGGVLRVVEGWVVIGITPENSGDAIKEKKYRPSRIELV